MQALRRILVGLDLEPDGSDVTGGSRRAALQAQWLAERVDGELTFLHSTWHDAYEKQGTWRPGPGSAGFAALEEVAAEYRSSGLGAELLYDQERPGLALIRRVLRGEHDLVMVARRNRPVSRALGSVTRELVRKCPCPVWVVKPDAPLVHSAVMAATDLTPVGTRAVELAAWIARAYGCELHVVHAWQTPFSVQMAGEMPGHEDDLAALQARSEKSVRATLATVASDVDMRLHVGRDAPSRAILEGVERLGVDLLVMGTLSRAGIAGLLVGNTAEKLLDRAPCSLLAVKPEGFVSPVSAE